VDLFTGKFDGYVWSANCGWISLNNAMAYVQTDTIQKGALAANGLPIAWLLQNFGTTSVNANADPDGDGMSNLQEYLAGTNPNDPNDYLRITSITHGKPTPAFTALAWTSVATRFYVVQESPSFSGATWADYLSNPVAGWNSIAFSDPNAKDFFRVRAYRPLTP